MCYKAECYVNKRGEKPVIRFIFNDIKDIETQSWIISGIKQLEIWKGRINNQNLETKHVRNKIFELKFKKLPIRILFAYHPKVRKRLLLLHGIIKKRDNIESKDIDIAESRYNEIKNL